MTIKPYQILISANSESEAEQKKDALNKLASQLDGITLKALADKVPDILKDPFKSAIVRSQLGLK